LHYKVYRNNLISWKHANLEVREAVKRGDDPAKPKFLPRLCYTSKATFEETMAVVIENGKMKCLIP
jgi:hypothetical protein